MSLIVWLPLNGDLENQGLSNMTFSYIQNNGALSLNNSGKIGKCYERTASAKNDLIRSSTTINLSGNISMACWAYVTGTIGDTANGLVTNHSHADSTGVGITVKQISTSDYRISCNTGTGSSRTYCTYYGTTNIKNAWHHLALTYNKTTKQLQLWVDGKVEYTLNNYTNASKSDYIDIFNWSTTYYTSGDFRPTCKLNDVRIYDHCLSAKEVGELAKGLVLHYRLAGPGGKNLMPNSFNMGLDISNASTGVWRLAGSNTMKTRTRVKIDDSPIGQCYGLQNSGQQTDTGDASCYGIDSFPRENGVTYTASFYARTTIVNTTAQAGFSFYDAIYVSGTDTKKWASYYMTEINNSWKRCIYTFISTSTSNNIYIGIGTDGVDTTTQICGFKLEKGSVATPWCPNPADALYSTMGYNNNIEYDCSGYRHNGTKSGTITWDADSPRYTTSYNFSKSGYIYNNSFGVTTKEYTISLWVKLKPATSQHFLFGTFDSWTGNGIGFYRDANQLGLNCVFKSNGESSWGGLGTRGLSVNTWYMVTYTSDGTIIKRYLNGIYKDSLTYGKGGNTLNPVFYIANSKFNGTPASENEEALISDVRFYATALSDSDIAELYHSAAIVDNTGKNYAYEYFEAN